MAANDWFGGLSSIPNVKKIEARHLRLVIDERAMTICDYSRPMALLVIPIRIGSRKQDDSSGM